MDRIAATRGALVCFRLDLVRAASLLYFATATSSDSSCWGTTGNKTWTFIFSSYDK